MRRSSGCFGMRCASRPAWRGWRGSFATTLLVILALPLLAFGQGVISRITLSVQGLDVEIVDEEAAPRLPGRRWPWQHPEWSAQLGAQVLDCGRLDAACRGAGSVSSSSTSDVHHRTQRAWTTSLRRVLRF